LICSQIAKHQILNKTVYNEKDDNMGDIRAIVFSNARKATHPIVATKGFWVWPSMVSRLDPNKNVFKIFQRGLGQR